MGNEMATSTPATGKKLSPSKTRKARRTREPEKKSGLLFVGVGNAGKTAVMHAVTEYDPKVNKFLYLLVVEPNSSTLKSVFNDEDETYQTHLKKWTSLGNRLHSIQLGEDGLGAGGDAEQGKKMATEKLQFFKDILVEEEINHVIFFAGASGGSAGALEVLAQAVVELEKTAYSILATPRLNEGYEKIKRATEIYEANVQICPVTRVRNENIPNKKVFFADFYKDINEKSLFKMIWILRAMLQETGDVADLDGKDWKTGTRTGKYSTFGFFDARNFDFQKPELVQNLKTQLLDNPYLEKENIEKSTWIIVCLLGKEWTVEEYDLIVASIQGEMENNGTNEGVQIKPHIQTKNLPEGTKAVGFVTFASKPPTHRGKEKPKETSLTSKQEEEVIPEQIQPPTYTSTNNGNGHKVPFRGAVNGIQTPSEASPEMSQRYHALWATTDTSSAKFYKEAREVLDGLLRETGYLYDLPNNKPVFNGR